jgi:hypothetical protein
MRLQNQPVNALYLLQAVQDLLAGETATLQFFVA